MEHPQTWQPLCADEPNLTTRLVGQAGGAVRRHPLDDANAAAENDASPPFDLLLPRTDHAERTCGDLAPNAP